MNKKELSRKWSEKGFSCESWVDPPGQTWENYVHDVDEVVYVEEGIVEFEIGGKKHVLKSTDEAFIPAHVTHSVRNVGGSVARWFYGYKKV